jgi:rubrerythrin
MERISHKTQEADPVLLNVILNLHCLVIYNTIKESIMITGKENVLQALIEAYLMEKGTKEFYAAAAKKMENITAADAFKTLTGWEDKHMEYIQTLYQALEDDRDLFSFQEFMNKTEAPETEAGIPVKDLEAKLEEQTFADENSALEMALSIEGKAYNLYRRFSEQASDANARVAFKEMMEQELRHIDYIKKMRENIVKTS